MRLAIFTLFLFSGSYTLFSQDEITKILIIGTETGGAVATYIDPNTDEKSREYSLRFGPHLGAFLNPRMVVGAFGAYEWHRSDFGPDHPELFELGGYFRYYVPVKVLQKEPWKGYFLPFVELAYARSNHAPASRGAWETSETLDFDAIYLIAGMNIRVFRQLHLDVSLRPRLYLPNDFRWSTRLGLEYHFGKTDK
jgi:hypothetical protein